MDAWLEWIEARLTAQRARHGESIAALKARIAELERQLAAR
jgi:hydrogenase nickel incorporation protein HypB